MKFLNFFLIPILFFSSCQENQLEGSRAGMNQLRNSEIGEEADNIPMSIILPISNPQNSSLSDLLSKTEAEISVLIQGKEDELNKLGSIKLTREKLYSLFERKDLSFANLKASSIAKLPYKLYCLLLSNNLENFIEGTEILTLDEIGSLSRQDILSTLKNLPYNFLHNGISTLAECSREILTAYVLFSLPYFMNLSVGDPTKYYKCGGSLQNYSILSGSIFLVLYQSLLNGKIEDANISSRLERLCKDLSEVLLNREDQSTITVFMNDSKKRLIKEFIELSIKVKILELIKEY